MNITGIKSANTVLHSTKALSFFAKDKQIIP